MKPHGSAAMANARLLSSLFVLTTSSDGRTLTMRERLRAEIAAMDVAKPAVKDYAGKK